jgi:gluconate 5-dehydrogenase
MFDLKEKVVLVAGGAGYLGTPICKRFIDAGATVVIADLNLDRAQSLARDLSATALALDIGKEKSIQTAVQKTIKQFRRIDALVNCTYFSPGKSVEELSAKEFDRSMHVNLTGSFLLARQVAQTMKTGGSIVNFASMYGQVSPDPRIYTGKLKTNPIDYGVAKAGIIQMTKYLAVYFAPKKIRVNAIAPGPFPNPAVQKEFPAFTKSLAAKVPLGRVGKADEIAGAVAFLASDEASFITGETLSVNGGWTAW